MPLPAPDLDTRTYDDLVAEAVLRIPRTTAGWTDHNAHDPGITIVELAAWLTELLLYRADRVPSAAQRAFMRLAGVQQRAAGVAGTVVALRRPPGGAGTLTVGPGLRVTTADRARMLQAADAVPISAAWVEVDRAETTRRGVIETPDGAADQTTGRPFAPFGAQPGPGAALRLGFQELPATSGGELRLHAWTPTWERDGDDAARIAAASGGLEHHDARVRWEYLAAPGDWRALEVLSDDTRALTLTGTVQLQGPAAHPRDPGSGLHWIRCRLVAGTHDCPPRLALIAINPVHVHDAVRHGPEQLGNTHGGADEELALARRPIAADSTRLRVEHADGTIDDGWREVAEWDETGLNDRHYRLDPVEGSITFGDGQTGRVPPAGAAVTALRYRVGGGADGNLPAGQLVTSPDTSSAVLQPFAVTGGAPAEPIERTHARALAVLERSVRGVTGADFEALARDTPGVRLGRAVAVPRHHPAYGCLPAEGVLTLVVLPACGDPPIPSAGLLAAVRRHVGRRRVLTTELHVVGPQYRSVTITATLHLAPCGHTAPEAAAAVLARFLDPLHGGEDGRGWPFGRAVLDSEVMAALGAIEGVRYVDGVGIAGPGDASPRCGSLPLCPLELPHSGLHRITVEES